MSADADSAAVTLTLTREQASLLVMLLERMWMIAKLSTERMLGAGRLADEITRQVGAS